LSLLVEDDERLGEEMEAGRLPWSMSGGGKCGGKKKG
jgi:hypothetical protein